MSVMPGYLEVEMRGRPQVDVPVQNFKSFQQQKRNDIYLTTRRAVRFVIAAKCVIKQFFREISICN